jgi:hypothetical protein
MIYRATILLFATVHLSCAEVFSDKRQRPAKPSDEVEPLPGYLDEASRTVNPEDEVTIVLGDTTLRVPAGSFNAPVFVKMARSAVPNVSDNPEHQAILESPASTVVEVGVYESAENLVIVPPSSLKQSLSVQFVARNVSDAQNLKAVSVENPGTEEQSLTVTSARDLDIQERGAALALLGSDYRVGLSSNSTHARMRIVETEVDIGGSITISQGGGSSSSGTGTSGGTTTGGGSSSGSGTSGGGDQRIYF